MAKKMNAKKRIKNQLIIQAPKIRGDKINGRRPAHSYARIEDDGMVHAYYSLGRKLLH